MLEKTGRHKSCDKHKECLIKVHENPNGNNNNTVYLKAKRNTFH